jgi:hypothetical protein
MWYAALNSAVGPPPNPLRDKRIARSVRSARHQSRSEFFFSLRKSSPSLSGNEVAKMVARGEHLRREDRLMRPAKFYLENYSRSVAFCGERRNLQTAMTYPRTQRAPRRSVPGRRDQTISWGGCICRRNVRIQNKAAIHCREQKSREERGFPRRRLCGESHSRTATTVLLGTHEACSRSRSASMRSLPVRPAARLSAPVSCFWAILAERVRSCTLRYAAGNGR